MISETAETDIELGVAGVCWVYALVAPVKHRFRGMSVNFDVPHHFGTRGEFLLRMIVLNSTVTRDVCQAGPSRAGKQCFAKRREIKMKSEKISAKRLPRRTPNRDGMAAYTCPLCMHSSAGVQTGLAH